ncbi:hypothetical protein [Aliterella atlantica]|uniref:hypothetical protein n=1 Tax=Aliterella atlantica TaxID=1827278 RepID=UPI001184B600|nr:hypothetical protein [Aliterella atlantica]
MTSQFLPSAIARNLEIVECRHCCCTILAKLKMGWQSLSIAPKWYIYSKIRVSPQTFFTE